MEIVILEEEFAPTFTVVDSMGTIVETFPCGESEKVWANTHGANRATWKLQDMWDRHLETCRNCRSVSREIQKLGGLEMDLSRFQTALHELSKRVKVVTDLTGTNFPVETRGPELGPIITKN